MLATAIQRPQAETTAAKADDFQVASRENSRNDTAAGSVSAGVVRPLVSVEDTEDTAGSVSVHPVTPVEDTSKGLESFQTRTEAVYPSPTQHLQLASTPRMCGLNVKSDCLEAVHLSDSESDSERTLPTPLFQDGATYVPPWCLLGVLTFQ